VNQSVDVPLSWVKSDIEQRLGFRGGRFTRANSVLTVLVGGALSLLFYAALVPFQGTAFADMFTKRGWVQYATVFLTAWSLVILFIKWRKLALQRRALAFPIVPAEADFVLSSGTVDQVMTQMYAVADNPRSFLLFNRVTVALSNLRNLGRVSDVDDILRSQADQDESGLETSYSLVQGFVWAIPVLGFIGTVIGLSDAIGSFSGVLAEGGEADELATALRGVTSGLATAFETTLVALVAALIIQMILTFLKKGEEEFLDNCSEYCTRHVVGRLRIMPFEQMID
jgi:biopolymer transport protein ExbB/TolQ